MDHHSVIPSEQLDLLLNAPGDAPTRVAELNDWERFHHDRNWGAGRELRHWYVCGECGCLTQNIVRSRSSGAIYCGQRCLAISDGRIIPITCSDCGRPFDATPAQLARIPNPADHQRCPQCRSLTTLHCEWCDRDYRARRALVRDAIFRDGYLAHFCSTHCRDLALGRIVLLTCPRCQREFEFRTSGKDPSTAHFCSNSCARTDIARMPATAESRSRSSIAAAYGVGSNGSYVSSIEAPVGEILSKLGIEAVPQWPFAAPDESFGCCADFFIPAIGPNGTVCEVQGTYWHSDPHRYQPEELNETQLRIRELDRRKRELLELLDIGYIEIWERDIRKGPERIEEVLLQQLVQAGYRLK